MIFLLSKLVKTSPHVSSSTLKVAQFAQFGLTFIELSETLSSFLKIRL